MQKTTRGTAEILSLQVGHTDKQTEWMQKLNTYCFFHLDLVDLYSKQFVLEITIKDEFISIFYILALWIFNQYSCFSTS